MLVAQITDCHIVEPGGVVADRVDTAAALRRAIATIEALDPLPDLVIATGDLVNDGLAPQYDHLMEILSTLSMPVLPIAGNHDDRTELRRRFPDVLPAGGPDDPIDYVVDVDGLRLVGLDTIVPGSNAGAFQPGQLDRLGALLAERPDRPTLIFQHHPPFATGIAWMDVVGLDPDDAAAEAEVVARHPQVVAVVAGHIHRSIHTRFGGTVASCWPSTGPQVALELGDGPVAYSSEPAGVVLHRLAGGTLTSHLVPVVEHERWTPTWALPAPSRAV